MTDLPVLVAGQRRDVLLDGTTYTIRALTYAEHSALQLARAARPAPSNEAISDALRQAAEQQGRADLAEALTAYDEAEDALAAFHAATPPALDAEGRARWLAEHREEMQALHRTMLRAARQRRRALELFGAAPQVAALRDQAAAALRAAALDIVAAGLVAIDGKAGALTQAQVAELPSAHVSALTDAIAELLAPRQDSAKN